jgi:hypothetical protein
MLALPRSLARELRWGVELRARRLRAYARTRRLLGRSGALRRAWVRTDPHAMARLVERISDRVGPRREARRPPVGSQARYRGVLTGGWRGDLRVGDVDFEDWLASELGGHIGDAGVRVELSVRVLADEPEATDADA